MNTAYAYIEMGMAKTILIIGAETLSREVDWSDRSSCILFGDGAGAAIMRQEEGKGGTDCQCYGIRWKPGGCADL